MKPRQVLALALLGFVPLSAAAESLHWGDGAVFVTSVLAILPLAVWLSTATEELSLALGPNIGALLNALFGNATELIIALTALRAGLVGIVKASITGTVMANLLWPWASRCWLGASAARSRPSSRWWRGSTVRR